MVYVGRQRQSACYIFVFIEKTSEKIRTGLSSKVTFALMWFYEFIESVDVHRFWRADRVCLPLDSPPPCFRSLFLNC